MIKGGMAARISCVALLVLSSVLLAACSEAGSDAKARGAPNGAESRSVEIAAQQAADYASGAAAQAAAARRNKDLQYHCNDAVVLGVVHDIGYEQQDVQPGQLLFYIWHKAEIDVRQIISGVAHSHRISARYLAHMSLAEDASLLLILHPDRESGYIIEQAVRSVGERPRLSSRCSGSPMKPSRFQRW